MTTPNWDTLLSDIQVSEVAEKRALMDVDAPDAVVQLLTRLRGPSATGKRQRGSLPVGGNDEYLTVRATLASASRKLTPPGSVTCKPIFAEDDEIVAKDDEGNVTGVAVREGAQPIRITFTVGERRGAKKGVVTAEPELNGQPVDTAVIPVEGAVTPPVSAKSGRGGKR